MKIDFYCTPGSASFRFHPDDVWGRGLGGAELSLISLAETLAGRGHGVNVFHDPPGGEPIECSDVVYHPASWFWLPNTERDVFILFRNPYSDIEQVEAKCKLFWSCDQLSAGNYATDIYPYVDRAVCISQFHKNDHVERYSVHPEQIEVIDLGVRLQDYQEVLEKVPGKLIFCAVPHRGLPQLARIFPKIKERCPQATLHITADYRLWGPGIGALDGEMRELFEGMDGVFYHGKLPREELVKHQLTSDLYVYPHYPVNGYPELFGVSVAECMAAGCVPIVSNYGALSSTGGWVGRCVFGDPREETVQRRFTSAACLYLKNPIELKAVQQQAREKAFERFDWDSIAKKWEGLFEEVINGNKTNETE